MSAQKSILSFFSKPQSTKKEEDVVPDAKEVGSTEKKQFSNGLGNQNGTPRSTKKKETNGKVVTSTPKRKKSETTSNAKKTPKPSSSPAKKRKRVQIDNDDEDDDAGKPQNENSHVESSSGSPDATPNASFRSNSFANGSSMMMEDMDTSEVAADETGCEEETDFEHTSLEFLQPNNIRDLNNRTPDDDDYDPTTLYVPQSYLKKLTPGLRRWWQFKSENFDKILLYKVGKFYELYHMDAEIAVSLLNLTFMKSAASDKKRCLAHCGFPEIAFGRFSDQLVQKGYKVARIEQTEKPEDMKKRQANTPGKKENLVRREICRIITPGTKTYSYIDGDDGSLASRVLLALCETFDDSGRRYGVCFTDCAVGKVWLSEFDDDYHCSRLRTLLAQYPPAEIIFPKKRLSSATDLLLGTLSNCKLQPLVWKTEFLTSTDALKKIAANGYFVPEAGEKDNGVGNYPAPLRETIDEADVLASKCKKEYELGVSALGAIVWYLEKCLIDTDVLTLKLFEKYEPPGTGEQNHEIMAAEPVVPAITSKTMILDSAALTNLDVLHSSSKPYSNDGTLLELLDSCCTPFGKRLLRYWLCNPLCDVKAIKERQEAIGALLTEADFVEAASSILKAMPDLERLLQKVHTMGTKKRSDHPDSRAVFFEAEKYNKRKVDEFLTTLDGLREALRLSDEFKKISSRVNSRLLQRCLITDNEEHGRLPNLRELLRGIESKFDRERAKKDGIVVMLDDVEEVNRKIGKIESDFDAYLKEQRKRLSCSAIKYAQTTGKNRFLLEIPDAMQSKVSDGYKFTGQVKGFRRYLTDFLEEKLAALQKAEDERDAVFADSMRRVFEIFSANGGKWRRALDCMSIVDVLLSLTRYAQNCEHNTCVPTVVNVAGNQKPFIEISNGYHPCASKIFTALGQFVPNDTVLGKDNNGSILLLTGPNMGGKSTLMRQVASLVILAQIGSYVPADSMSMSVVDRIFTRLGASDRLSAGQSTFAVELTETNMILQHATVHSLLVIDELGRGTATHDGAAIACSVLKHLAEGRMGPRTLFSTHYHSLVARLRDNNSIALGHMACTVETETEGDPEDNPTEETITFLYKLAPGPCPKSYGFHAAQLAGISKEIVATAYAKAHEIDRMMEMAQRLRILAADCQSMSDEALVAAMGSLSAAQGQK